MTSMNGPELTNARTADLHNAYVQKRQTLRGDRFKIVKSGLLVVFSALAVSVALFSQTRKAEKPAPTPTSSSNTENKTTQFPAFNTQELAGMQAVLETSMGDIVLQF